MSPRSGRFSARTEALAMRFDPQIKYMADLVSRQDRRSLTNFVEWAIDQALRQTQLTVDGGHMAASDAKEFLWDIDEAERLRKLLKHCPGLMRYHDQILINEINQFTTAGSKPVRFENNGEIDWVLVKNYWEDLNALAKGDVRAKDRIIASLQTAGPEVKVAKAAKHT